MKKSRGNKIQTISHYLGLDFGAAKVGLALADNETEIAFAFGVWQNDKQLMDKLIALVQEKNIATVVIGLPVYPDKKSAPEKLFGQELRKFKPGLRLIYHNEMFSTRMAQDNLIAKKMKGVKRFDDQEAARIILQSWLDSRGR